MLMSARVRSAWIHSRMKLKKMNRKIRKISTAMPATIRMTVLLPSAFLAGGSAASSASVGQVTVAFLS